MSITHLLEQTIWDLEGEIVLLRELLDNLCISYQDLNLKLIKLNQGVVKIPQCLEPRPVVEEPWEEAVQVQAEMLEDHLLSIGDNVWITSRVHFGLQGTVHSFTDQRVWIQIEGIRQLIVWSANNLQQIN